MNKNKQPVVVQAPEKKKVPTEILAQAIVDMAEGVRKLRAGRLNDRALVLLIQDAAPGRVSQQDIRIVLGGMENLERTHVRKGGK